jgi:uncharacterized Zn finger protein
MAKRRSSWKSSYDYGEWYPPSRPIETDDGIKAKSQRGSFGATWWSLRWIRVLESFGWGNRLQRGRNYARQGQVLNIDLQVGRVKAKVQGSRPTPYKVTLDVPPLTDAQWERAADAMAQQAIFAAKLLAGEMPQDIEEAFRVAGVPLFPQTARDIKTECSCPDFANPCKHIAAVYYLLGERFDEDPFLIFHLRGRMREQIMDALRARRAAVTEESAIAPTAPAEPVPALADLMATYYQASDELQIVTLQVAAPKVEAAILRRLGMVPAGIDVDLHLLYRAMTAHALEKVLGEE